MGFHLLRLFARAPAFDRPIPSRLILLGNLVWCALAVFSAGCAASRIPIWSGYPWIVTATVVVTLALISPANRFRFRFTPLIAVALFVVLILLLLWPYLFQKSFVSNYSDTWSYCTFAEYLARFPRGTEGGLQPVYQYASHYSDTRFGTPALLAFFGALFRTDAAQVLGFYALLLFSNVFWGVALLLRLWHLKPWLALCAGAFSISCGLIPDTLIIGSLDNLLFLSVAPHLLVRTILFARGRPTRRSIFGLAVTSAAAFYSYPEGAALFTVIFFPFLLRAIWRTRGRSGFLIPACSVIFVFLILTGPYLGTFCRFLLTQVRPTEGGQVQAGVGTFPGLASGHFLPALFGDGEEFPDHASFLECNIFTLGCLVFFISGLYSQCRRRTGALLSLFPFVLLILWQGAILRYDYGLFKVLVTGYFLVIFLIFAGIQTLAVGLKSRDSSPLALFCAVMVLALGYRERSDQRVELPLRNLRSMDPFVELHKMTSVLGGAPVLLFCSDDFNQQWAFYFLKDYPVEVEQQRGYMAQADLLTLMRRSKSISEPARYLLVDSRQTDAIWRDQNFWLIPRPTLLYPLQVLTSPNGLETLNEFPFIWIGNKPVIFSVQVVQSCQAILTADKVRLGPSAPTLPVRHLCVRSGNEIRKIVVLTKFAVDLELKPGTTEIAVWCEDPPTVFPPPGSDRRTLLVGLLNYKIEPK